VQSVVPRPDVAPLLQEHFVALAADADETEEDVMRHAGHLEDAYMLPFVMFVGPDGQYVDGYSGPTNPVSFVARLKRIAKVG
jgi:hypothetical protein